MARTCQFSCPPRNFLIMKLPTFVPSRYLAHWAGVIGVLQATVWICVHMTMLILHNSSDYSWYNTEPMENFFDILIDKDRDTVLIVKFYQFNVAYVVLSLVWLMASAHILFVSYQAKSLNCGKCGQEVLKKFCIRCSFMTWSFVTFAICILDLTAAGYFIYGLINTDYMKEYYRSTADLRKEKELNLFENPMHQPFYNYLPTPGWMSSVNTEPPTKTTTETEPPPKESDSSNRLASHGRSIYNLHTKSETKLSNDFLKTLGNYLQQILNNNRLPPIDHQQYSPFDENPKKPSYFQGNYPQLNFLSPPIKTSFIQPNNFISSYKNNPIVGVQIPGQNNPLQGISAQNNLLQEMSLQNPLQSISVQNNPLQGMAIQNSLLQGMPMQNSPLQGMSMQNNPLQGISLQSNPVQGIQIQNTPLQVVPVQNPPMQIQSNPIPIQNNPMPIQNNPMPIQNNPMIIQNNPRQPVNNPLPIQTYQQPIQAAVQPIGYVQNYPVNYPQQNQHPQSRNNPPEGFLSPKSPENTNIQNIPPWVKYDPFREWFERNSHSQHLPNQAVELKLEAVPNTWMKYPPQFRNNYPFLPRDLIGGNSSERSSSRILETIKKDLEGFNLTKKKTEKERKINNLFGLLTSNLLEKLKNEKREAIYKRKVNLTTPESNLTRRLRKRSIRPSLRFRFFPSLKSILPRWLYKWVPDISNWVPSWTPFFGRDTEREKMFRVMPPWIAWFLRIVLLWFANFVMACTLLASTLKGFRQLRCGTNYAVDEAAPCPPCPPAYKVCTKPPVCFTPRTTCCRRKRPCPPCPTVCQFV